MKLTSAMPLTAAACIMLASCGDPAMTGQIYNDLNVGIHFQFYGKSGEDLGHGDMPGRTWLFVQGLNSDAISQIEYTVGSGRSCQIDQSTFRKEIAGQEGLWQLHLRGC